jgi:hypothetical protein
MQLIFGKENAETLREKYTVLELETIDVEGQPLEVFCLVSADHIGITDLPQLEQWTKLHDEFLHGYHTEQYNYCRQCIEHLMGKFGGELDTFYEEILRRINEAEAVKSSD